MGPDTSWLFFEEENVSHRVREPHEWYQEGAVLLLQLRPLQRRLLRSDRSFHYPQPYSSSPGHQPPMTRFRSSSEGRAGLVWQGQGAQMQPIQFLKGLRS